MPPYEWFVVNGHICAFSSPVKHPIHRSKSYDWFKEGHMTWIILTVSRLETNPKSSFYFLAVTTLNLELDSLFSRLNSSVWTKKSTNRAYKTNINCSFIQGMVENYCHLSKIQPWPTIR